MDQLQQHMCIVLVREEDDSLRALVEQLADRDCRIEQHASAIEAFTQVCLHHRAHSTASGTAERAHETDPPALVIASSNDWPQLPAIIAACDRRLPIALWIWDDRQLTQLRAADGQAGGTPAAGEGKAVPQPRHMGAPELRLTEPYTRPEEPQLDAWSDPLPALDDPAGDSDDDAQRLTAQEIDMLLDTRRQDDES